MQTLMSTVLAAAPVAAGLVTRITGVVGPRHLILVTMTKQEAAMTLATHLIPKRLVMAPMTTLVHVISMAYLVTMIPVMALVRAEALMVSVGSCHTGTEQKNEARDNR